MDLPAHQAGKTARRWFRARADPAAARENTASGYVRIVGELRKLGIDVSSTLVRNVLRNAGIPPPPQREQLDWRSFLRQHAATTLACDFFTVDTVLRRRLYVLVEAYQQLVAEGYLTSQAGG